MRCQILSVRLSPSRVRKQMAEPDNFDHQLDAQGLLCPEPLMLLRQRVREMQDLEIIKILATDPSTERDFANFCRFLGHEMVYQQVTESPFIFYIKKT